MAIKIFNANLCPRPTDRDVKGLCFQGHTLESAIKAVIALRKNNIVSENSRELRKGTVIRFNHKGPEMG